MIFIIGGAYQGKLEYAREQFALKPEDIFSCEGMQVAFSAGCIDNLERFTLACTQNHVDPVAVFREQETQWRNAVLICDDLSCGVVPMDDVERQWRQENGRLCQYLARNAQQVSRIFCGLEQRLK